MAKYDRITALFFFFLALGICIESVHLSLGTFRQPGPGFLSFVSGIVIGTFSAILYWKNRKKREEETKTFWDVKENKTAVFSAIGALILYALLFEFLGFLISTMAFFLFICRFVAKQKWSVSVVLSVVISIAAFLIFDIGFQSQLPKGIIGSRLLWIFGKMLF